MEGKGTDGDLNTCFAHAIVEFQKTGSEKTKTEPTECGKMGICPRKEKREKVSTRDMSFGP